MIHKIAVILTVFNRKQKTVACLEHLFEAVDVYNRKNSTEMPLELSVFMTDDGCKDGTAEAVRQTLPKKSIRILQADGNQFWAGGMRLAWQAAIDSGTKWDYYLLLNDDTVLYDNVFEELLKADEDGYKQKGRHGLSSGITCQPNSKKETTYGGFIFTGKAKGRHVLAQPTGKPQSVDMTHANILLVHHEVVEEIGIFYHGFRHGAADEDYSLHANRKKFPIMVTANICGECVFDHDTNIAEIDRLKNMTLSERKQYVNSPTHSDHDYLLFVRRNLPMRYPIAWLLRTIRLYFPGIYKMITHFRGIYK